MTLIIIAAVIALLIWIAVSANRISWAVATPEQQETRIRKRRGNKEVFLFCSVALLICWLISVLI